MRTLKSMIHMLSSSAIVYVLIFSPVSFNFELNLPAEKKSAESKGIKRIPYELNFNFNGGAAYAETPSIPVAPTTSNPGGWTGDACLSSGGDATKLAACDPGDESVGEYIGWSIIEMFGVTGPFDYLKSTSISYWVFVAGSYYEVIADLVYQITYNNWKKDLQNGKGFFADHAFNKKFFEDNKLFIDKLGSDGKAHPNAVGDSDQLSFAYKAYFGETLKRMMLVNRKSVANTTMVFYIVAASLSFLEAILWNPLSCAASGGTFAWARYPDCLAQTSAKIGEAAQTNLFYVGCTESGKCLVNDDTWGNALKSGGAAAFTFATNLLTGGYDADDGTGSGSASYKPRRSNDPIGDFAEFANMLRSSSGMADLYAKMDEKKRFQNHAIKSMSWQDYNRLVETTKSSEYLNNLANDQETKEMFNDVAGMIDQLKSFSLMAEAHADGNAYSFCGGSISSCLKMGVMAIKGLVSSQAGGSTVQPNAWKDMVNIIIQAISAFPVNYLLTNDWSRTGIFTTASIYAGIMGAGDNGKCKNVGGLWNISDAVQNSGEIQTTDKLPTCEDYPDSGPGPMSKRVKMLYRNETILKEYARKISNLMDNQGLGDDGGVFGTKKISSDPSKVTYKFTKPSSAPPKIPIPNVLTAGKSAIQSYNPPSQASAFSSTFGDIKGIYSDAASGNFGGSSFTNANSTLTNNAAKIRKYTDKILAKMGDNADKLQAKQLEVTRDVMGRFQNAVDSAIAANGGAEKLAAMGVGPGAGGVAGVDAGTGTVTKVNMAGTKPSSGAAGAAKPAGFDYSKMFAEEEKAEEKKVAEKTLGQAMEEYDVGEQDINKNDKVSIWQVISNRYFKSYPKVLEEINQPVAVPLAPEKKDESKK